MTIEYDLHVHSHFSDGSLSPDDLVILARDTGLKGISITDHDNCDAYPVKVVPPEIEVIPGIELSTRYSDRDIEILGYFIDPKDAALNRIIDEAVKIREDRIVQILELLKSSGIDISIGEVRRISSGRTLVRPHVAEILVNKGLASSIQEAFNKFLNDKRISDLKKNFLSPEEVIHAIHESGGLAVLAHPFYFADRLGGIMKKFICEMSEYGLDGLELHYPYRNINYDVAGLKKFLADMNMVYTGGSDYHGSSKKHINVGVKGIDSDEMAILKERLKKWRN